jgi:hypothetical protein
VIEANDYIGGRTKSEIVPLSNGATFAFEEGANWIHGSGTENPVTKLAANSNIALVETLDDSLVSFDMKGKDVSDLVEAEWDRYDELLTKGEAAAGESIEQVFRDEDPDTLMTLSLKQPLHFQEFQRSTEEVIPNSTARRCLLPTATKLFHLT